MNSYVYKKSHTPRPILLLGSDLEDYKSLYSCRLVSINIQNNPVIKDIDKNITAIITYQSNISYPASVRLYLDNNMFQEVPCQLSSATSQFIINLTTSSLLETKYYTLSSKLIGLNGYESAPVSSQFEYIDPVDIVDINFNPNNNRKSFTIDGKIVLKENGPVVELQLNLDNSSEILKTNTITMDNNHIQHFNFNFPYVLTKGNHIIHINAFNKDKRKIGTKKHAFKYNPANHATNKPNFRRFRKR